MAYHEVGIVELLPFLPLVALEAESLYLFGDSQS